MGRDDRPVSFSSNPEAIRARSVSQQPDKEDRGWLLKAGNSGIAGSLIRWSRTANRKEYFEEITVVIIACAYTHVLVCGHSMFAIQLALIHLIDFNERIRPIGECTPERTLPISAVLKYVMYEIIAS